MKGLAVTYSTDTRHLEAWRKQAREQRSAIEAFAARITRLSEKENTRGSKCIST